MFARVPNDFLCVMCLQNLSGLLIWGKLEQKNITVDRKAIGLPDGFFFGTLLGRLETTVRENLAAGLILLWPDQEL